MTNSDQSKEVSITFRPVQTKRASEAIFEQIRDLIIHNKLQPGDRLPSERNMIEMFQRSRPTIREALRMLERAGYIRTMAGSNGAIVMPPNDKNLELSLSDALSIGHIPLEQLAEYRTASEAVTAAWAAQRRTDEDIRAMEAILAQMADCLDDYERSVDLDPDFHGLIAKAAKNSVSVIFNRTFSRLIPSKSATTICSWRTPSTGAQAEAPFCRTPVLLSSTRPTSYRRQPAKCSALRWTRRTSEV